MKITQHHCHVHHSPPKGAHPIPAISVASLYPSSLVTFLGFHSTHDGVVLASPSQCKIDWGC